MISKYLFIVLFTTAIPALADTLAAGSVYFDSAQTLNEVIHLSAQHDNEGIAKLIANGHVSSQIATDTGIVVLASGSAPDSPAEFRFLNGPTTYWTLTRNVTNLGKPVPESTPAATEAQTPAAAVPPAPVAEASPKPDPKHHPRQHESRAPFDDDNGQRIWHQVNGKWKWYLAKKGHAPVKRALPPEVTPSPAANQ